MPPEQPTPPTGGSDYNFIMSPEKPKRLQLLGGLGGDSFITKIVFIVGGALALIIVLTVVVNVFFGDKTNSETFVELAQSEQEIVRLSSEGDSATNQEIKNAALNTLLSTKTHQQAWLSFLQERSRVVAPAELALKKDATTDTRLKTATQTSTFDSTYTAIMRAELDKYATALKSAYDDSPSPEARTLLRSQYQDAQLLLTQWPSATLGLATY